jgi:alpha-glucosidase (family GH31 glycosyl hydrolase)
MVLLSVLLLVGSSSAAVYTNKQEAVYVLHNVKVTVDTAGGWFVISRKDTSEPLFEALPNDFINIGAGELDLHSTIKDGTLFNESFETQASQKSSQVTISKVTESKSTADMALHISGEIKHPVTSGAVPYSFNLHSSPNSGNLAWDIDFSFTPKAPALDYVSIALRSADNEEIYGMGLQYSRWNLKGLRFPIISSEQGVGRGLQPVTGVLNKLGGKSGGTWYTTYSACSTFITNRTTGLYVNTSNIGVADFSSTRKGVTEFSYYHTDRLDGYFVLPSVSTAAEQTIARGDARYQALMSSLTELTGRMRPLPDWVLEGAIVGTEGGQEAVAATINRMRDWKVPMAGVWLQDWAGEVKYPEGERVEWNWELNKNWYSNWTNMVNDWRSSGIRVLT